MIEYVTTHDPDAVVSRWRFEGTNRDNTDHGRAYVEITKNAGDFTVSVYSDAERTNLVAEGTIDDDSGEVILTEQNGGGLSGGVRLNGAALGAFDIDIFYADDDDVLALQNDVGAFLDDGQFAGYPGFSDPLARAKRVMDALMNARFPAGWRAEDLQPLAETAARYALFFIYDHLSTREGDPASHLAKHWRREARDALPRLRISISGAKVTPFDSSITRA